MDKYVALQTADFVEHPQFCFLFPQLKASSDYGGLATIEMALEGIQYRLKKIWERLQGMKK